MRQNRFKTGFTLLETICVLTITILVLGISIFLNSILKQKYVLTEQRFFETLKITINEGSISARNNNVPLKIYFQKDRKVIVQTVHAKTIATRRIQSPRSIKLAGNHVISISASVFISPQTIRWYTNDGRLKYLQKFQLGWSGFKLEK